MNDEKRDEAFRKLDDVLIKDRLGPPYEFTATYIRTANEGKKISNLVDLGAFDVFPGKSLSSCAEHVYGIDINPEAIEISRKNGLNVKRGDVNKRWEFADKSFDVVIVSHIIEHVDNTDHLILEAKRVLKKGGLIVVITPNLAAWFNRIFLVCGMQPFFSEVSTIDKTLGMKFLRRAKIHLSPLGHLRLFTGAAVKDIVKLHGFKIIKTAGLEFTVFPQPLLLLDRLFAKKYSLASNVIVVGKKP